MHNHDSVNLMMGAGSVPGAHGGDVLPKFPRQSPVALRALRMIALWLLGRG